MNCSLSNSNITSFRGDILPLWLVCDEDLSNEEVVWGVSGDSVKLTSLSDDGIYTVNHGVLLVFDKIGQSTVFADFKGRRYECSVICREINGLSEGDNVNYYLGNFHDHTSKDHNAETFPDRENDRPANYINKMKKENLLDCTSITDHAILLSKKDFFETFSEVEKAKPSDIVIFPGNESDVSVKEKDRFGIEHNIAGEVVCLNADGYVSCSSWSEFADTYKNSPLPICIFAHPQEMGGGNSGLWGFDFTSINSERLKRMFKGIELGNGRDIGSNAIQEYSYSQALDAGFRVSTTLSSDWHANWSFNAYPGKTVVMACEKSKEAFVDSLNNMRFYGCESANLKLDIKVNGRAVPCELDVTDKYRFKVDISYFTPDVTTTPIECKVVSDYGKCVKVIKDVDFSSFEFEIETKSARYFYLRFVDEKGRRTWSPPVFTGRPFDEKLKDDLCAIDKSDFSATDIVKGCDAALLIDDDPSSVFTNNDKTAEIVIDMKKEYPVRAIGHYAPRCLAPEIKANGINLYEKICGFVSRYSVYTSKDNKDFYKAAEGVIRSFGKEEVIRFEPTEARYIKFVAHSTVGKECGRKAYENSKLHIAELAVFADGGTK